MPDARFHPDPDDVGRDPRWPPGWWLLPGALAGLTMMGGTIWLAM